VIQPRPPEVKLCPRGWRKVRGKCIPPVIQPRPPQATLCPKGWRKVRGKCTPPMIQTVPPKVKLCPRGWRKVRGKCTPPNIQMHKNLKVAPKVKPVTRLNRSLRVQSLSSRHMLR